MKFAVGTMLTAFGLFWSTEGAGADWPGADAALLVIVPGGRGTRRRATRRCCGGPGPREPAA